jgi:hypothetical protein
VRGPGKRRPAGSGPRDARLAAGSRPAPWKAARCLLRPATALAARSRFAAQRWGRASEARLGPSARPSPRPRLPGPATRARRRWSRRRLTGCSGAAAARGRRVRCTQRRCPATAGSWRSAAATGRCAHGRQARGRSPGWRGWGTGRGHREPVGGAPSNDSCRSFGARQYLNSAPRNRAPHPPSQVHIFDALAGSHVASYPGHRDIISGLAFREGTHTLYSASFDRTIKIWSIDDGVYGARRGGEGAPAGAPGGCAQQARLEEVSSYVPGAARAGSAAAASPPRVKRAAPPRARARRPTSPDPPYPAQSTPCLATRQKSIPSTHSARSAS